MPSRSHLIFLVAGCLISVGAPVRADAPAATQPAAGEAVRFNVVIWYDRSRPFETLRYRAYNLARGEFTKAVDDWMALVRRDYPGYTVAVRAVEVTEGDPGDKVAAAVEDEKLALAKSILVKYSASVPQRNREYGSGYNGLSWSPQTTAPSRNSSPFKNGLPSSFSPLGAAHPVSSPTYLFPNPMPYPRPHP